jgi:Pyridoxal-dependent decarboxylase, pyridoxal binding domain
VPEGTTTNFLKECEERSDKPESHQGLNDGWPRPWKNFLSEGQITHVMTRVNGSGKAKQKADVCDEVHHLSPERKEFLRKLAFEEGTPLFVIDHEMIRENYREFKEHLPSVQVYYAVKANSNPEIVRTLFKEGCSFDVASMPEFMIVYENIKDMPDVERQEWIWDKIIYANGDVRQPRGIEEDQALRPPCRSRPQVARTQYRFARGTLFQIRGRSG